MRGPFHTRQISFSPSLGTVKETHQGTSLCPCSLSGYYNPLLTFCVCMWSNPLPYPCSIPEVSFVSDLHSKRTLLTYLPTTGYAFMILNRSVNAFLFLPQLTLCQTFSLKTEGPPPSPVARIEKSDLSTRAAAACLDACPNASQIPGFVN